MSSWDSPVSVTSFFEPCWHSIPLETTLDLVFDLVCWSDAVSLGRVKPSGFPCRLLHLPVDAMDARSFTLFRVKLVSRLDGIPHLDFGAGSTLCVHQPLHARHYLNLVEFCAGMGASSIGLAEAGFSLKAAVEWNEAMANLHRQIHNGIPVIQGDIGDIQTLIDVKKACKEPFSLMAGVSCQPYSRGGSQSGVMTTGPKQCLQFVEHATCCRFL